MTKLRISIVQYLNTAPLVWGFTNGPLRGKYDLSFTVPSQCAEQLRGGLADVAIIPAIEYQRIANLAILPEMAIASKKQVRSLLLVAKHPIRVVKTLALDSSSRSTQALTRILCKEYWKIDPQFSEAPPDLSAMLEKADAALLIGDPALRFSIQTEPHSVRVANRGSEQSPLNPPIDGWMCRPESAGALTEFGMLFVYDIVEQWRSMTGLPAVLAMWAARRDVTTPELAADFLASREFGLAHLPEISAASSRELDLPAAVLETYLRDNIDFSLDEENRRGLETYFQFAAKHGLIEQAGSIEWAARAEAVKL